MRCWCITGNDYHFDLPHDYPIHYRDGLQVCVSRF